MRSSGVCGAQPEGTGGGQLKASYSDAMSEPDIRPLRHFTEAELATIGRVVLLWGMHEQDVGTVVGVFHKTSHQASVELVHRRLLDKTRSIAKKSGASNAASKSTLGIIEAACWYSLLAALA